MHRLTAVGRFAAIGSVLIATSSSSSHAAVLYVLQNPSTFQQGCFPPCACPVMETDALRGTFEMGLATPGDVYDFYSVDAVRWTATGLAGSHMATGSGTYKISLPAGQNELQLDLSVDQGALQQFDSGSVPPGTAFPDLDVTISLHGMVCWDTAMRVDARPTPRLSVERTALVWDSGLEIPGYDVVAGSLRTLRSATGDFSKAITGCVANDLHDHTVPLANLPVDDEAFYLVRAGKSTYDTGAASQVRSRDPGIAASPVACP